MKINTNALCGPGVFVDAIDHMMLRGCRSCCSYGWIPTASDRVLPSPDSCKVTLKGATRLSMAIFSGEEYAFHSCKDHNASGDDRCSVAGRRLFHAHQTTDAAMVKPAPADRVFALPDQGASTGNVVVTRDIGAVGSKCAIGVMVDEQMAAHLNTAESVTFALKPGRHLLTVTGIDGPGLCSFNATKSALARRRSTEIFVDADTTQKYRLSFPAVESPPVIEPAF
ncbi:hypothetical protein [Stenotrophomonas sp. MYb57]|uniref:hypothetical protein n=1 Tax=Stenotrophomonas sp. MYb57 TaxID=1827305 RepID=UPI001F25A633|nr:hypothetical protein [Stenotrophomonas sp. MYb57]